MRYFLITPDFTVDREYITAIWYTVDEPTAKGTTIGRLHVQTRQGEVLELPVIQEEVEGLYLELAEWFRLGYYDHQIVKGFVAEV